MIPEMTNQEAFNKAYLGLIRQGKPSHDGVRCMYRSPEGMKCAVGMPT